MEDFFVKTQNITYDCFVFFSSKQKRRICWDFLWETHRTISSLWPERWRNNINSRHLLSQHVRLRYTKRTSQLLKETVSPTKALEIATLMEMGSQNKQNLNQNPNTNAQSVKIVNKFQGPIAPRTTNCNENNSLAIHLSPKTINTPVFVVIVDKIRVNIFAKSAPKRQVMWLLRNYGPFCQKVSQNYEVTTSIVALTTNERQPDTTSTKSEEDLLNTSLVTNNSMIRSTTPILTAIPMTMWQPSLLMLQTNSNPYCKNPI